jgi:hypothetical protein
MKPMGVAELQRQRLLPSGPKFYGAERRDELFVTSLIPNAAS